MDIVAIPRNFDNSDSAWLCYPSKTEVRIRQGASRNRDVELAGAMEVMNQENSKVSVRALETKQKNVTVTTPVQKQGHRVVDSVGGKATQDTMSVAKTQQTIHWLKDEEMLRKTFKVGRIQLLRSKTNLSPRQSLSIDDVAFSFLNLLIDSRKNCRKGPIIFVGHNAGIVVIERTLMLARNGSLASGQIFFETAGIVFLSTPDPKTKAETEKEWNYFDATARMSSDQEELRYLETSIPGYIKQHLELFRRTLEEANRTALNEVGGALWHDVNVGPSAISLSRYQYLDIILETDDAVYVKIVNAIASSLECYQLLSAASEGSPRTLRSILSRGIDVNLQDRIGNSALHLAAITGHAENVKLLLVEYQAHVGIQNSKSRSALFLAVGSGKNNLEIVTLLLKKGARLKDDEKRTLSESPRVSKEIIDLLKAPPFVEGPMDVLNTETWQTPTAPKSAAARDACKSFKAVVAEFFQFEKKERSVLEDPTIHQLLYEASPEIILENARKGAMKAEGIKPEELSSICRWYHIPANNVGVRCLC